jgi:hypothetical protein
MRAARLKRLITRIVPMNPFAPTPPDWAVQAQHAHAFCCPRCLAKAATAEDVWLNRRSPVYIDAFNRKWQEFYLCHCGQAWWAWSSDRPPSELNSPAETSEEQL